VEGLRTSKGSDAFFLIVGFGHVFNLKCAAFWGASAVALPCFSVVSSIELLFATTDAEETRLDDRIIECA